MRYSIICVALSLSLFCSRECGYPAEKNPNVIAIDLVNALPVDAGLPLHLSRNKDQSGKEIPGEYRWELPEGTSEAADLSLTALGIKVGDYDELRFELKPLESQVNLSAQLFGYPAAGELSSWYLKFKAGEGEWTEGRYDLRVDDDGVFLAKRIVAHPAVGTLRLQLSRRILGYTGEPRGRTVLLRNLRLVRRALDVDFSLAEAKMEEKGGRLIWTYPLTVRNRTEKEQTVLLDPDSRGRLRYFRAEATPSFTLAPGRTMVTPVRLSIDKLHALSLPPCYAEPAFPTVRLTEDGDTDAAPLSGYQRRAMWGVVPVFVHASWTPAAFRAHLAARQLLLPELKRWQENVRRTADAAFVVEWTVPVWDQPPGFDQNSRCNDCGVWLVHVSPLEFHNFKCPKCGKNVENNPVVDQAMQARYYAERAENARNCALAWLITAEDKYAQKALAILDAFASVYHKMPVSGMRSTAGGSRLGGTTLSSAYRLPVFAEAWNFLKGYDKTGEESRARIELFLQEEALRVARHCVEYNNMQAEHFRAYGTAAIATGFWPLAAEAIYGDFGWHEVAEYGYSIDGISHESGSYHHSIFNAMNHFAEFSSGYQIPLFTASFKRVFDGSLLAGYAKVSYEAAYNTYRDPAYLPVVNAQRKHCGESTLLYGAVGVPDSSEGSAPSCILKGAGYVYLRTQSAGRTQEIRLNYLKNFDRLEHDKFTTFFFQNNQQIDGTVGRIVYSHPGSGWMERTQAHNCIVVDGNDAAQTDGILTAFSDDKEQPAAMVQTDPAAPFYPGVVQTRAIALIGDIFVVVDRIQSDEPHTIDRYQHGQKNARWIPAASEQKELPPFCPAIAKFTALQATPAARGLRVDFENGLRMRLVSDKMMTGYQAKTFRGYQGDAADVTFARISGEKEALFAAAFVMNTPGKDRQPPELQIAENTIGRTVVRVLSPEGPLLLDMQSDNQMIEVRKDR